jgi:hypothetical protein
MVEIPVEWQFLGLERDDRYKIKVKATKKSNAIAASK